MGVFKKLKKYYHHAYGHENMFPSFRDLFFSNRKIYAYYGFLGDKNFGDEWVYESAKFLFSDCILLPIHRFMPFSGYLLKNFFSKRISGIVIGGGTLIGEGFAFKEEFLELKKKGLPVFTHGTGVHGKPKLNEGWKFVLTGGIYGGVRGRISKSNMLKLGGINVEPFGDAAFAMFENRYYDKTGKRVLINMGTHFPYEGEEQVRNGIYQFVEFLIANNFKPVFLPFHEHDVIEGEKLKDSFKEVELLEIPETYQQTAAIFETAIFALGERLHFIVMASMKGCPFYSVNYSEKHFDFLDSIGASNLGNKPLEVSFEDMKSVFEARNIQDFDAIFELLDSFKNTQLKAGEQFITEIS